LKCDDFGEVYTVSNEKTAKKIQTVYENKGYIVHIEYPNGDITTTKYSKIVNGGLISQ